MVLEPEGYSESDNIIRGTNWEMETVKSLVFVDWPLPKTEENDDIEGCVYRFRVTRKNLMHKNTYRFLDLNTATGTIKITHPDVSKKF